MAVLSTSQSWFRGDRAAEPGAVDEIKVGQAQRLGRPFNRFLEIALRSSFLGRLRNKAAKFLSLMRESLHLMTRKLALNVKRLFDIFRVNEPLRKLEVRLQVRFGVFTAFSFISRALDVTTSDDFKTTS